MQFRKSPKHHLYADPITQIMPIFSCVHVVLAAAGMASSVHGAQSERAAEVSVL